MQAEPLPLVLSASVLVLVVILDCVDGELAKARRSQSLVGRMVDGIGDGIVFVAVNIGLYLHLLQRAYLIGDQRVTLLPFLILAAMVLGLVGFNLFNFHKGRAARLMGFPKDSAHDPEDIRGQYEHATSLWDRVALKHYLIYCHLQRLFAKGSVTSKDWPPGSEQAQIARRHLKPIVLGWSFLGPSTYLLGITTFAIAATVYPLALWWYLWTAIILSSLLIVVMLFRTQWVDTSLRVKGIL